MCRSFGIQNCNESCSPGRIRPGLRAKRAMKTAGSENAADEIAAANTPRFRFSVADDCVRPYTSSLGRQIRVTQNEEQRQNPDDGADLAEFAGGDFHQRIGDKTQAKSGGDAECQRRR
jgi:hypothetical protein